jgi:hypothetical protein
LTVNYYYVYLFMVDWSSKSSEEAVPKLSSGQANAKRSLAQVGRSSFSVRLVSEEDADQLLLIAEKAHSLTIFSFLPFSRSKVARNIRIVVEGRAGNAGFVCLNHGAIVGAAHVTVGNYIASDVGKVLSIQSLFVSQEARSGFLGGIIAMRLLSAIVALAKAQDVQLMALSVTSGESQSGTHRLAKKLGMSVIGGNYAARIQ